ncbi:uncharacterized protein VICG_00416 [Vittaforma corneae ATCC 50505]|uniref:Rho-GAP domain-containing protein n=1 Tax=Vittaforma corneae (strain ATCC 50505) TaxID=993615 RepID=L2GPZ3_VITCO|nr:uncharacterized protein VICG_00416 [Vittaforma corneae ATCC 50505]ELA42664.1 hypothetical protein VICG_00416 [Vittaforma corneae ATCC 50505]
MENYVPRIKSIDYVLKTIKETSVYKRGLSSVELKTDSGGKCPKELFSSLSTIEKGILRKKCIEYLSQHKNGFFMQMLCISKEAGTQKKMHESLFELIVAIESKCLDKPGIFRREGDKEAYKTLVEKMTSGQKVDFSEYDALILGSALKSYIRDYLDGFFDPVHLEAIVSKVMGYKNKDTLKLCKYLVFSLSPQRRRCLLAIRNLFNKIEENKEITKMSYESLCNIFLSYNDTTKYL